MASGTPVSSVLRSLALTLAILPAAMPARSAGDVPPEGREPPSATTACPEPKSGAPGNATPGAAGSACTPGKSDDPPNPDAKSSASRPDRYGTGYEARKGQASGGGGRGRGGRGR